MSLRKRKKNTRLRGSTTHGSGLGNKHNKGAGNRGGRGNAGSGKRGDAKKPSFQGNKKHFGRFGFVPRSSIITLNTINLKTLDDNVASWTTKGMMEVSGGVYKVNLSELGYDKLLSTGNVTNKFEVTVDFATPKAVSKLEEAGGKAVLKKARVDVAPDVPSTKSDKEEAAEAAE